MTDLSRFRELVAGDHGLCVVSTTRPDGTVQSSVVNAGVLEHPTTRASVVGLVAVGGSRKLAHLRSRPQATIVVRVGFQWAAVEGDVELIGPDDPYDGVGAEELRQLLRDVFTAAGGTHDDWDTYDRVMAEEHRTAVLITPRRTYGVP